jgi:exopolysaccharide biosynthesis polyprenyl glycosylphosphotransferase
MAERRPLLLTGDAIAAFLALVFALWFWGSVDRFPGFSWEFIVRRPPAWFFLLPVMWLVFMVELYDIHRAADRWSTVRGVGAALLIGLGIYLLFFFYYVDPPRNLLPRRWIAGFFIAAPLLTLLWRFTYIRMTTAPSMMRRVLLVGGGKVGEALLKTINDLWPPPFYVVGVIDDDPNKQDTQIEGYPVLGTSEKLMQIVEGNNISDIITTITGQMHSRMFRSLLDVQERGVELTRFPRAYEELLNRVPILLLEADWILRSFIDELHPSGLYELSKRLLDILGGLVGVLILLILLPFLAVAILLDDGWPIFYTQTRAGQGNHTYEIIKFRTMRNDAEADGKPKWAREDDQRATRVGRFLRKTHLDELPQFLNVLRGEMSMVGPRAERPELMKLFEETVPFYRARLLVKPGITGWAQINFGYASNIDETVTKLEYDLYYIKHRNLLSDILILLRTPATIIGFRGR